MRRRHFFVSAGLGAVGASIARSRLIQAQDVGWQHDGAGTIARFWVVTPDFDPAPESEMWAMVPRGVSIHAARVARGAGAGRPFVEPPHVFPCTAATAALRVLGVQRLSVVHPPWFSEALNDQGLAYWRAAGFDVLQCTRLQPLRSIREVPAAEVFEFVIAHTPPAADAVLIGGNGLRAVGAIRALEARLQKPVLSANQVVLWEALRAIGRAESVTSYGSIFRRR